MNAIGIIANPGSGRDIRRLVAHGSIFDNHEKVNIVRRILVGAESAGADRILMMPETFGIGRRALDGVDVSLDLEFLDMPVTGLQEDTTLAAQMMDEAGVAVIVTLGGDGTNRVAAKGAGSTPLLPISTGTNNVFPRVVEGTLAGLAAGAVAAGMVGAEEVGRRAPCLEVLKGGRVIDLALIDAVVSNQAFTGARAIWDPGVVREIFLTRSRPGSIGFSAVGGLLRPLPTNGGRGLWIKIGPGGNIVRAPIAPGLIADLPIADSKVLEPGEEVPLEDRDSMLALDGEREVRVREKTPHSLRLSPDGPFVLDVDLVLEKAGEVGFFVGGNF